MPFPIALAIKPEPEATETPQVPAAEIEQRTEGTDDTWQQEREVRLTAQRILGEHLRVDRPRDKRSTDPPGPHFWPDIRLNLVGATLFDWDLRDGVVAGAEFTDAKFTGDTRFDRAEFTGDAWFGRAKFNGPAGFRGAEFKGAAWFREAKFNGQAGFGGAKFKSAAWFSDAKFNGDALFGAAGFNGVPVRFGRAKFKRTAAFSRAEFTVPAGLDGAKFKGDAWFREAKFNGSAGFGGAEFIGDASFTNATFGSALFTDATFTGNARFDGAEFTSSASFGGATFSDGENSLSFDRSIVTGTTVVGYDWPAGWELGPGGSGGRTVGREHDGQDTGAKPEAPPAAGKAGGA